MNKTTFEKVATNGSSYFYKFPFYGQNLKNKGARTKTIIKIYRLEKMNQIMPNAYWNVNTVIWKTWLSILTITCF